MAFPAQFNLSSLDGNNGFVINGIDYGDKSGFSVSSAGDMNGDGVDDVIIGASSADPDGNKSAGESYVVFGSEKGFNSSLNLSDLNGSNGFVIKGTDSGDSLGKSVSSAGDINGDGIDDLIMGASNADPDGKENAGESYVIFGSKKGFKSNFDLSSLDGSNGFVIKGTNTDDSFGESVSSAGDVNGDGIDDMIIGAIGAGFNGKDDTGKSHVIFGSKNGFKSSFDLSSLDGKNGFTINGINSFDFSGFSVSSAGDINGDGIDDMIIGASLAKESYVLFGSKTSLGKSFNLSDLDGKNGFVIKTNDPGDSFGKSVSSAGDINGDGIDDLIMGASGGDPNGNANAGKSYVVFGSSGGFKSSLDLSSLDGKNGFVINGIDSLDSSGKSVSSAGDVNGDKIDDLIIGASGAKPDDKNSAGESYVVFGSENGFKSSLDLSSLDGSNGFVINGIDVFDFSGFSVSGAGDMNGDGVDDFMVGASSADPNGQRDAGESYVVFGGKAKKNNALVQIDGKPVTNPLKSYGGETQDVTGTAEVSPSNQLNLSGNLWRRIEIDHTITPDTILNFDFKGNGKGEIQGIGFDNNNVTGFSNSDIVDRDDSKKFFQVDGSQSWGREDLDQYILGSTPDGFTNYSIPVGDIFTGEFDFLTIANDHDVENPTAVGQFQNIELIG